MHAVLEKRAACALRISDIKLKDRQLFAKRRKRYAVMSFIIMTARIMVNVRLQKSLLEQEVGSVFMQEVITGGALRICHIIQIQSLPKKFAEACRSYKTNKIAKKK